MSYTILDIVKGFFEKGNLEIASKEIRKQRLDCCNQCPANVLNICKGCGCFIPTKVSLTKSECPLNKWEQ